MNLFAIWNTFWLFLPSISACGIVLIESGSSGYLGESNALLLQACVTRQDPPPPPLTQALVLLFAYEHWSAVAVIIWIIDTPYF